MLLSSKIDSSKLIFPKGILSKVKENDMETPQVKRIELFAKDGEDTYGIIRSMFVGYSSEESILEIAEASGGVVQVRAVVGRLSDKSEKRFSASSDTLILKRSSTATDASQEVRFPSFRQKLPSITVPPRWKDRMKLSEDDRLIISSPIADYSVLPPNI
jgi:hypothetical protein